MAAAELHLPASLASILNATTPLFTALIAALGSREPFTGLRLLGLLVGFAGVALLAGLGPVPLSAATLLAVAGS
ncbi:MAG: EamA/RhaT family transporter, partial [Bacillota bacterium]